MPINILMPALSPTMEEGTLAKWLVTEGQRISSGTVLAEIETDKATMEFESVDEGTIGKIVVAEGTEGVKVNDLIAVLLEAGESDDEIKGDASSGTAIPLASSGSTPAHAGNGTGTFDQAKSIRQVTPGHRIFASPLARRIAAEREIDLGGLAGSGPNGRIVKSDVLSAAHSDPPHSKPTRVVEEQDTGSGSASSDTDMIRKTYADRPFEEITLDGMRKTIAERLALAKQTIPHFYLRRDILIDDLLSLKNELNEQLAARDVRLSVNDFIIKATANALQEIPDCNAVWAGDRILRFRASDVAVAVAIEGGLFTPVLRDAETKTLSTLSSEMKDLAIRARERKLAPHEYQGGSLAISNLGMMGIDSFDAVINPPHASILAVGSGLKKPVVTKTGEIEAATVMSVTMSVDHRVIDGALGARFLQALITGLENPLGLLA